MVPTTNQKREIRRRRHKAQIKQVCSTHRRPDTIMGLCPKCPCGNPPIESRTCSKCPPHPCENRCQRLCIDCWQKVPRKILCRFCHCDFGEVDGTYS